MQEQGNKSIYSNSIKPFQHQFCTLPQIFSYSSKPLHFHFHLEPKPSLPSLFLPSQTSKPQTPPSHQHHSKPNTPRPSSPGRRRTLQAIFCSRVSLTGFTGARWRPRPRPRPLGPTPISPRRRRSATLVTSHLAAGLAAVRSGRGFCDALVESHVLEKR